MREKLHLVTRISPELLEVLLNVEIRSMTHSANSDKERRLGGCVAWCARQTW
jgi:hypothetical protein